jgi:hypothetical protein
VLGANAEEVQNPRLEAGVQNIGNSSKTEGLAKLAL